MNIPIKSCCILMIFFISDAYATNFEFNFNPHGTTMPGGPTGLGQLFGATGGNDGTRFIQDTISIGGRNYFHVVIEDPNSDFRQESYTDSVLKNQAGTSGPRSFSPFSGGNERSVIGNFTTDNGLISFWNKNRMGNAKSPLGFKVFSSAFDQVGTVLPVDQRYKLSGNGTMDPSRVVLSMNMSDASVSVQVDKPLLDRKPKVSQTLSEGTLTSQFIADMTGVTYADSTTNTPITNVLTLTDPNLPIPGGADFDMSQAQNPNVTAGQYIYTPGGGWSAPTDPTGAGGWDVDDSTFAPGAYTYSEGGFDVLNVDWASFFDAAQNPNSLVDNGS